VSAPHLSYSLDPPRHPAAAALLIAAGVTMAMTVHPAGWAAVLAGVWNLRRRGAWYLADPWKTQINGYRLIIAEGFRFDLASIPRPLWLLIAPHELSVTAPLAHDFLYAHRGLPPGGSIDPVPGRRFTRRQVDRWFRLMMALEGVPRARRTVAWAAVRCFGWIPWLMTAPRIR